VAANAEMTIMATYSAARNIANFTEPYSRL